MEPSDICICPNCGKEQSVSEPFCHFCGAPLCFGDTERNRRIRQLLDQEEPASAPAVLPPTDRPPVLESGSSEEGALREEPAPSPATPEKGGWIRRHKRRALLLAAAAAVVLTLLSFPLRNALLGYHASPQALVDGFNNAVEESDRDALSDLFWTDEEDPFQAGLSGTMSALSGYCRPLIYVSQDHDWGSPYAVITVYYGELTDSSDRDPYVNSKEEITAERYSSAYLFTVAAIKRDGQWYFSAGDYTTLMRSSFY